MHALHVQDLREGDVLETALVRREDTKRVIRVDDEIDVWVKKTWPSEGRFCLTLDDSITEEKVEMLSKDAIKVSTRLQHLLDCCLLCL